MYTRSVKLLAAAAFFAGGLAFLGTAPPALALGDGVSYTLEGCKGENLPADWVLENNEFLCDGLDSNDNWFDAYTTGNLGKTWNELDLVPFRLITEAGSSAPVDQTYEINITADREDAGAPGYDVITAPVLNGSLSDESCWLEPENFQFTIDPGIGGTDKTIARTLMITQGRNSVCVFDYVARLAFGSHLFPGSSLHANLLNEAYGTGGVGNKAVSIPVRQILPQTIAKEMDAVQGGTHEWSITKGASPGNIVFDDTCGEVPPAPQLVTLTVTWTKSEVIPGEVMVTTDISATNPAHRTITVQVTDEIFGDIGAGDESLDVFACAAVDVPAGSTGYPVCTHVTNVASNATALNDIATATYIDPVTGVPVPGMTEATASSDIQPGSIINTTASITDTESISDAGLTFSVDSFTGNGNFFGYTAGTETTGPVNWSLLDQSDSGSVVFTKSVYANVPIIITDTLQDDAELNASDGAFDDASADVTIQAYALYDLTITKTIPDVLQDEETASFDFIVTGPEGFEQLVKLSFGAGDMSKSVTLVDLEPGSYNVHEVPISGWYQQADQPVTFSDAPQSPADCAKGVTFDNTFSSAHARVEKTCIGSGGSFDMTLDGPGGPKTLAGFQCGNTDGTFDLDLQEGSYTISETVPAGWVQSSATGCEFDVDYPRDAGTTFVCEYTNTQLGRIIIDKVTIPGGDPQIFDFTLTGGPSGLNESFGLKDADDPFVSIYLLPGSGYAAAETVPDGWDLSSATCDDGSPVDNIDVGPGETVKCTFTNQQGNLAVIKNVVNACTGSLLDGGRFNLHVDGGDPKAANVKHGEGTGALPVDLGLHTISESAGTATNIDDYVSVINGDCDSDGNVTIASGDDSPVCNITNIRKPKIVVRKSGGGGAAFDLLIDGEVVRQDARNGDESIQVAVDIGSHTISELDANGNPVSPLLYNTFITCSNGMSGQGTSLANVVVNSGDLVICTIYNNPLEQSNLCVGPNDL